MLFAPGSARPSHLDASRARRDAPREERSAERVADCSRHRQPHLNASRTGLLDLRARRSSKPLSAHIHKGRAGTSGPVFIPLGKTYKTKGCASAAKKLIDAVESNPNAYYVNVHNAKYPNGIVRGQLVAGMVHM